MSVSSFLVSQVWGLVISTEECFKPMPVGDSHSSGLKCLSECYIRDWCQIYKDFKPRIKKDLEARLKFLFMEVVWRLPLEPS